MLSLIPRDYWEYGLLDVLRAMSAGGDQGKAIESVVIPGVGDCLAVQSARAGIVVALRALGLGEAARVGVPLYCCPVVFDAITTAGCVPRFIDIDASSFCLSVSDLAAKRSQLDALIAVHMFGNVCAMPAIKDVVSGLPIIEDCAQAIGSTLGACHAGLFGAISVFSFRSGKYVSAGEGGALYTGDAGLREHLSRMLLQMKPKRGVVSELRHVALNYIKSRLRSKPFYGAIGHGIWSKRGQAVDSSERHEIKVGRAYNSDLTIARWRLPLVDNAVKTQRANAGFLVQALRLEADMLCSEPVGARYNRYLYPVTFDSRQQRDWMADYLLGAGVDSMRYLDGLVDTAIRHFGYAGDCPVSERLSRSVLAIPNYHALGRKELVRIAEALNRGWNEIGARRSI